jgi:glutathione S-transferase
MGAMLWRYMGLDISRPDMPHVRGWLAALESREPYRNTVMAIPRAKSLDDWNRIERETA